MPFVETYWDAGKRKIRVRTKPGQTGIISSLNVSFPNHLRKEVGVTFYVDRLLLQTPSVNGVRHYKAMGAKYQVQNRDQEVTKLNTEQGPDTTSRFFTFEA